MNVAIWIIAVCEVIRAAQNVVLLIMQRKSRDDTKDYIQSFKAIDRELAEWQKEAMKG
jgi:hypothetical protein